MTVPSKKRIYIVVGLLISAIMIWILFREIDFNKLGTALRGANYWWLLPNIALIVLTMYQRAYRWKFMLQPIGEVAFPKLLAATCVGFMANNVLPLRLGEFVRAYSLSAQDKRITKSASLATIFVERMVFDLVVLLLIFGAVLFVSDISISGNGGVAEQLRRGVVLAIVVALIGIAIMIVLARRPEQVGSLITRYLFFVPESGKNAIERVILKFQRGLEFLNDFRAVWLVSVQTVLIWLLMGISNIFVFWAFDLDVPVDASFVVLVVVSIAILVPSSPGYLGIYHLAVVWSLQAYGVNQEEALSCALVLHAAQYMVVTLLGFYHLKRRHLSLKSLEEEADELAGSCHRDGD
ncbi:MAG: lysylphosphatidylglycerol synthase transmembrane domain-containing protein [bacterium]